MLTYAEPARAPAPPPPPSAHDRAYPRLVPDRVLVCQMEHIDGTAMTAWVQNLSVAGLAALTTRAVPPGSRLRLVLINASAIFSVTRTMTVLRCERQLTGRWLLAGPFDLLLSTEELRPFLV